jgi:hypothetical protein
LDPVVVALVLIAIPIWLALVIWAWQDHHPRGTSRRLSPCRHRSTPRRGRGSRYDQPALPEEDRLAVTKHLDMHAICDNYRLTRSMRCKSGSVFYGARR